MLNQRILEEAFGQIEELSYDEISFDIGGVPVTIRVLGDGEEVEVVKYANVAWEIGGEDGATTLDYIQRLKASTLAHAIVSINGIDLSGSYVTTGDTQRDGTPIRREKVEVARRLVGRWSGPFVTRAFQKYGELATRIQLRAEKSIVLDPVDFDLEISRLERRIEELKMEQNRHEAASVDSKNQVIQTALDHNLVNVVQQETLARGEDIPQSRRRRPLQEDQPPAQQPAQPAALPQQDPEATEIARLQEELSRRQAAFAQRQAPQSPPPAPAPQRAPQTVSQRVPNAHAPVMEPDRMAQMEAMMVQTPDDLMQQKLDRANAARMQTAQNIAQQYAQSQAYDPNAADHIRQHHAAHARAQHQAALQATEGVTEGQFQTRRNQAAPIPVERRIPMKRRQAPHVSAQQAAQQVYQGVDPRIAQQEAQFHHVGTLDQGGKSIPVFKAPGQTITGMNLPTKQEAAAAEAAAALATSDPVPGKNKINPQFTPRNRNSQPHPTPRKRRR